MAFEKEQSFKHSFMAALLSGLIWIVFLPVWLVVVIFYEAHVILSSRKLGVSATALGPMTTRWLQHQLGLRRDDARAKLIKVLPNHCYAGLYAAAFPVLLGHRLAVPEKKWIGAAALLYAFYIGLSVSMTVHWFSDFASGIIFGIVVGTTVGRSFAVKDFPSRGDGVQNVPHRQFMPPFY